jgi:hypothetical protein
MQSTVDMVDLSMHAHFFLQMKGCGRVSYQDSISKRAHKASSRLPPKSTKILLAIKHGHSTSGWREGVRCFFLLSQSQSHVDRLSEKKDAPLRTINRCMHRGHETGSVSFNFFFFLRSFLPSFLLMS